MQRFFGPLYLLITTPNPFSSCSELRNILFIRPKTFTIGFVWNDAISDFVVTINIFN